MRSPCIVTMALFLALASLTGCARSDTTTTLPPGASLDGMFSVDLGATDGVSTGKRWGIFVNDPCTSSRTLTMKRSSDLNPAVAVADPEKASARTTSSAAGFHGRYRATLVDKSTGETTSDVFYDVGTFCLRTGEKCITLFVSESRRSTLAYAFADSKWVTNPTPFPVKCDDGQDDKRTRTDVLTLPDPVRDPFQTVTGTVHTVDVGPCPLTMDLNATIERVGDSKPI